MGATYINSADWLAHPGSVGKSMLGPIHILDDDGDELPAGRGRHRVVRAAAEPARLRVPQGRRRRRATRSTTQGWSTVGDMGYLDDDGYLFLTDRTHVHDRVGRREHLSAGSREPAHRPPEGLRRRGVRHPRRRDGRARARRRAAGRLERRRARARTRAARVLPANISRTTSARRRSTSTASCRASRPASSTSACCATATGATRPAASSDAASNPARCSQRAATATSSSSGPASCCARRATAVRSPTKRASCSTSREHGYPGAAHRRGARRRHRDRDGTHRRPDDDGRR